ncbi:MAG: response regulator, partial [Butyrivibrio sp.]|nr:response regulator [Butyrivibrio sp.]
QTEMAAPPDDGGEMPPGTDEPVNRQREYGVPMRAEDTTFDTSYLLDSRLMSFNLKLFLMLLCVAFPIVGLINFFAKMKIGTPIGELSSYMMSFMDTTDDNRLEYAESIHQMQVNTHDEISELYHAISSTVMEITEYIADIQEEARLREELKVAQAASEAKSGFLSNMSHEIRTPINAVLGMDEMILRETHEPEIRQYAADIRSAGNTLLSLVNDILDFSKIEAGKMDILPVQYQLSSTINDLVNMIRDRASAKGLAFNIQVDETVPNLLYGDEIRLKQCVTNILTNAVKYTNEGSVTLNIGWHEAAAEEEMADVAGLGGFPPMMLTVRVTDTGIGIKEEDLGKLFSPFERIEEIRNRTIEGTGLGMSIVKKLLAMMETKLVVHSVYGEGSDFSFEVRQGIVDPEPMGDFATRYKEFTENLAEYRESFQAPEARILVTDDTRINLTVIRGLLKQTRIEVDTAESGRETLRKICETHYDVIFLDHMMPEMDGIETRAAMADLSGNLNVDTPCIALTANAVAGAREEYLAAGFADYLSKPVDPERLERMLMEYLPPDKVLHEKDPGFDAHATDAAATETAAEESDEAGQFAACTGIDVSAALAATGSPEVLADVLRDFYESIPEKSDAIEQFAAAGDLKNYTVQVHALKSSARIIGAEHLSSLAAQMEAQGNTAQGNGAEAASAAEEIRLRTPELLALYRSYREHLAAMDAPQEDPDKPEIDAEELASALSNIRELAEAYDLITAEQILQMLDAYRIPAAEREKVAEIRQAMRAMDRERLLKVIS